MLNFAMGQGRSPSSQPSATLHQGPVTELIVIIGLSLLVVPLVALTTGPLRIAISLIFILFFPGYTLVAALFPKKGALDGMERIALSFGLSIALVPLIGLALNYTPWGIRLYPILVSLLVFIVTMAAIAWQRRQRLSPGERFQPPPLPNLSLLSRSWSSQGRWDKLLTTLLVIAILGAIGALVYTIATPKVGERFTEFYILGPGGKAQDYPRELMVSEEATVIVGIANQEQEPTVYRVEVNIDAERVAEVGTVTLDHEEVWEQELSFAPARAGPNQKVEFRLYRGEESEPYHTLHLWVDVEPGGP